MTTRPTTSNKTDAEKLLAVCRTVWPADGHACVLPEIGAVARCQPQLEQLDVLYSNRLDDLRRVLLALNVEQRCAFNCAIWQVDDKPMPHGLLTAPTTQILDALYKSVVQ